MDQQRRFPLPRGWLSLALLTWAGFTGSWAGAVVMALMLEALAFTPVKWAMAEREFHRAADLTSIIFALVTVLQFSRYGVHGIYEILKVSPYCFFPLLLAQRASTQQTIPLSALFYSLRRQPEVSERLDVAPHFVVICVLAASAAAERGLVYIGLCSVLLIGLLAGTRPRRYPLWQSLLALTLATGLAGATGLGILGTQRALENTFAYWMNQFPWSSADPNRAITAIGQIGRLKLSDQIRVRVTPAPEVRLPLLLQEASYDAFRYGSWSALEGDFAALDQRADAAAWDTATPGTAHRRSLEITFQHPRELALLPLPRGTQRIDSDEISELQRNGFGTIMSESPPGALRYRVSVGDSAALEPPPRSRDLVVPDAYQAVIEETAAEIGGQQATPGAQAESIRRFFFDNFRYSLIQRSSLGRRTPLANFLRETRRGHCEYFATATVLLLRQAGIPARYAVGYVVENYSALERAYIARARHAHAWALAYLDGSWTVVDTTPALWYALEDDHASRWQGVQDVAAWVWYRMQRLRQDDFGAASSLMIWLVPPLALVLYLRLRRSPSAVRMAAPGTTADPDLAPASPLAALLEALRRVGYEPADGETMAGFLRRAATATGSRGELDALIEAYNRWRYAVPAYDAGAFRRIAASARRFAEGIGEAPEK